MVAEATVNSTPALSLPDALPVLPMRGGIGVFPLAVMPLLIGQPSSMDRDKHKKGR